MKGLRTEEKLLQDEVHALYLLVDEEKFDREQQLMSYERWSDATQQQVAKSQYHLEKEARPPLRALRKAFSELFGAGDEGSKL